MKFLLLNLTLLAGVYCSWGCSCCADCYKKCCGKGDNEKTVSEKMRITTRKNKKLKKIGDNIPDDNKGQLPTEKNNDIKDEIKDNNKKENLEEDTKDNEEHNVLYFKIQGGAINNNDLGCFGNFWFNDYIGNNKNTILLYGLTEQKDKQEEVGTLVYPKGSKKLQYTNGGDLPVSLKDSDNKWAIFKVTTLNKDNEATPGESHIFYCSDVSTLNGNGLFEEIKCWSIEILAANTTKVEEFYNMFKNTKSYLEQDTEQLDASGFIGLEILDLSGANNLAAMFCMALFKQKTIDSLSNLSLRDNANITKMFYVNKNDLDFSGLNGWIKGNNVQSGYGYDIFFQGDYNSQNNDKLPEWCENKIKE